MKETYCLKVKGKIHKFYLVQSERETFRAKGEFLYITEPVFTCFEDLPL